VDAVTKVAGDLADLKVRLTQLEERLASAARQTKTLQDGVAETVRSLQAKIDKMQDELKVAPGADATRKVPEETTTVLKADFAIPQDQYSVINKRLDDLTRISSQVQANTRDLNDLKRRQETAQQELQQAQSDIGKLQQEVYRLRNQIEGTRLPSDIGREDLQRRSSSALPLAPESSGSSGRSLLGTVRLVNSYVLPVNVVVDGKMYTLAVNDTLSLDRLPGAFTYEVMGIQGNAVRTLSAGETLTIRVYPR
jgi:FtsZ-binding cell division protein ZapB